LKRSVVAVVSERVTAVAVVGVGAVVDWAQNVSPEPASTHWCTKD
jgi:hypothetical protein